MNISSRRSDQPAPVDFLDGHNFHRVSEIGSIIQNPLAASMLRMTLRQAGISVICACRFPCTFCPIHKTLRSRTRLLQRNKSRGVGGTNTGSTVLDRLVRDRKFSQIVAHHFRLDFHLVELLARVDTNDATNHLGHDDHVSQVCLDQVGLLVGLGVLLRLAEFLDQTHRSALQATVESAPGASVEDVEEFIGRDVEKTVAAGLCVSKIF
jgi:hypothetical protein